ncbi:hypothetical protein [Ancylobacter sp. IITR112]|uniref:hypothetical protein n=1 Tax=Ancylobacter sp. IITR112 TaxID=3138073 RepID=UPI00352B5D11
MLALINAADEIGPRASVEPVFRNMDGDNRIIEHSAEFGVGLQHLAILAGRQAHAETWPEIAGCAAGGSLRSPVRPVRIGANRSTSILMVLYVTGCPMGA